MSRARNLKPGFFKNERLAECQPLARILFEGLWCEADRAGRLEDRPKRIKAEILPYDHCDVNVLLAELADGGFIVRYQANGAAYIQVLAFAKHQNPHVKEAASSIPAPDSHGASTVQARCNDGAGTGKSCASPADSLSLDSPSLIPPHHPVKQKQPRATPAALPDPPDSLDRDAWNGFVAMRAKERHPLTPRSESLILAKLAKHPPETANAMLDQSTRNGWRDVFDLKPNGADYVRSGKPTPSVTDRITATISSRTR